MWLTRCQQTQKFINDLKNLKQQVLMVRGARQVGKTSFILKCLDEFKGHPIVYVNCLSPVSARFSGREFLGRTFLGHSPDGAEFITNLKSLLGDFERLNEFAIVFVDEVDRYPIILEAVQLLAEISSRLKFIFTGSNLENILVINPATGRKKYFDLYPVTFFEYIENTADPKLVASIRDYTPGSSITTFYHEQIIAEFKNYIRLGGMPKILNAHLDPQDIGQPVSDVVKDLATTLEENVKSVLGEKTNLYEYEDVLRTLVLLSMNTLKLSRLQVQHAGQMEAKKIVSKTVGARVAHKVRLWDSERDLSKYIIFDVGIANYLINGADLLRQVITERHWAIMLETFVGNELIVALHGRDDLYYWKSGNQAEVEFMMRSPKLIGVDVKSQSGDKKSLNSFALSEKESTLIIEINNEPPRFFLNYQAKLPRDGKSRKIKLICLPYYLTGRIKEIAGKI